MKVITPLFFKICLLAALLFSANTYAREACRMLESDSDGDGWGWEAGASCLITEDTGKIPEFYHPGTGERVNIERIFWVWEDFNNRTIDGCHGYAVDPNQAQDICTTCRADASSYFHGSDGVGLFRSSAERNNRGNQGQGNQGRGQGNQGGNQGNQGQGNQGQGQGNQGSVLTATFDWNVDNNGLYEGALDIDFYGERTENGVRFWQEGMPGEIGFYTLCEVIPSSMGPISQPQTTESALTAESSECVDLDGDGWGWNGLQTCVPE